MLATERHQHILARLQSRGSVRTVELAREFQVTDETIRRDFQFLADHKLLIRIHGGATTLRGRPSLQSFTERLTINADKKRAIAKVALGLIEAGQTYALDSSTTVFQLVSILPNLPYRVITNAHSVIDYLVRLDDVELVSIGGRFHRPTRTFVGTGGLASVRKHNVNLAIISCIGLDSELGASEGFAEQASFKELLVTRAERTVLLVDSTKLAHRSEYFFAELSQIDQVVTDSEADPQILREFERAGCEVLLAP